VKGRKPTKAEYEWLDEVSSLGCIVCRIHHNVWSPAEIHHLEGKTKRFAHFKIIPLCPTHHRGGIDTDFAASRHPYKASFEKRYGTEEELLNEVCKRIGKNSGWWESLQEPEDSAD